jgi:hypothetical protein
MSSMDKPIEIFYKPPGAPEHLRLAQVLDDIYTKLEKLQHNYEEMKNANTK